MLEKKIAFSSSATTFYFGATLDLLQQLAPPARSFILTDENLMLHYQDLFKPWKTITIPAGEAAKNLETLDDVIRQLIALDAGRDATLIGIGGGVVTDIAGFAAGIYKRGIRSGFVPTSILAMVDAAIGGKNGLDIGEYKNMIGLVRQPGFLLYDYSLLESLPEEEWINGFAEIIKHACIRDKDMFAALQAHKLHDYRNDLQLLDNLIRDNALLKAGVVQADEWEQGERRELNFGHTLGHAIENHYALPHGHAISIGMCFAASLSEAVSGFTHTDSLKSLLVQYGLPVTLDFDKQKAWQVMLADKKKQGDTLNYILLERIGKALVKTLPLSTVRQYLIS